MTGKYRMSRFRIGNEPSEAGRIWLVGATQIRQDS